MTFLFRGSSMAEHAAVNRRVVGSSPTRGAIEVISLQKNGSTSVDPFLF